MSVIKSKWIETREIKGEDKLILQRGQRVIGHKIVQAVVPPDKIQYPQIPEYITIVALECVEFEED